MKETRSNPFSSKELPLMVTVDVCDGSFDPGERRLRFGQLMELLPGIRERVGGILRDRRGSLPVTWYVRADMQVKEATGSAMGLVHGWKDFWDEVRDEGGEVGWHPHLCKRHGSKWKPIRDPLGLKTKAEKIWHEIAGEQWTPKTCRMGESVGSNELMRFLDSIGMMADASGLPGRSRDDGLRWFDWKGTPSQPYFPASGDYRRPSRARGAGDRAEGEDSLGILEVPFTMAGTRAPYDESGVRGIRRYLDLSFEPARLEKAVNRIIQKAGYMILVIHPLQAAGMEVPDGGLVAGGFDVMERNLESILKLAKEFKRVTLPMTLESFASAWTGIKKDVDKKSDSDKGSKREGKFAKGKGGTKRTTIEIEKSGRLTTKGGVRAENLRPRRGPRKRRG
jgi:hypothetical protein